MAICNKLDNPDAIPFLGIVSGYYDFLSEVGFSNPTLAQAKALVLCNCPYKPEFEIAIPKKPLIVTAGLFIGKCAGKGLAAPLFKEIAAAFQP